MKKNASMIWMALILMLASGFTACGKTRAPKNALEQIKADGVLTIAVSPDYRPMEFIDNTKSDQDQYVGFDISLAKFLAEELGVELKIQAMSFDECQDAVENGIVPMSISSYSWTENRSERFDLSDFYYATENEIEQIVLIRAEDSEKYIKAEDFDQKSIGAQESSLQVQLINDQLPNAHIDTVKEVGTGILKLKEGSIDAFAIGDITGAQIISSNPDLAKCSWKFDVKTEYQSNVIILHKNEPELLAVVNDALKKAYENGYYGSWLRNALELSDCSSAAEFK